MLLRVHRCGGREREGPEASAPSVGRPARAPTQCAHGPALLIPLAGRRPACSRPERRAQASRSARNSARRRCARAPRRGARCRCLCRCCRCCCFCRPHARPQGCARCARGAPRAAAGRGAAPRARQPHAHRSAPHPDARRAPRRAPTQGGGAMNVVGGPLQCCCTDPMTGAASRRRCGGRRWIGAAAWPGAARAPSRPRAPTRPTTPLPPGFYRDGYCRTGGGDVGVHVVCAQVGGGPGLGPEPRSRHRRQGAAAARPVACTGRACPRPPILPRPRSRCPDRPAPLAAPPPLPPR
jgi:hypothetical protein